MFQVWIGVARCRMWLTGGDELNFPFSIGGDGGNDRIFCFEVAEFLIVEHNLPDMAADEFDHAFRRSFENHLAFVQHRHMMASAADVADDMRRKDNGDVGA